MLKLAPHHCDDVRLGAYALPISFSNPPTILDIGANVGAYAEYCARRWPGSMIECYEPNAENFAALRITAAKLPRVHPHQVAVSDQAGCAWLFDGKNNCGECSLSKRSQQLSTGAVVNLMDARRLPLAHIVKIDAEGSEIVILQRMISCRRLRDTVGISLEYHSDADRRALDRLLPGYTLVSSLACFPHRGVLNYIRNKLVSPA